jgi:hypothetical protein
LLVDPARIGLDALTPTTVRADAAPPAPSRKPDLIPPYTRIDDASQVATPACCVNMSFESSSSSSLYWPPDVARYNMESVLYSSSGWLRTACIVFALFWYDQSAS